MLTKAGIDRGKLKSDPWYLAAPSGQPNQAEEVAKWGAQGSGGNT